MKYHYYYCKKKPSGLINHLISLSKVILSFQTIKQGTISLLILFKDVLFLQQKATDWSGNAYNQPKYEY